MTPDQRPSKQVGQAWRKSSKSYGSGHCVEIQARGDIVRIRDSMDPEGPILELPVGAAKQAIDTVKSGALPGWGGKPPRGRV